MVERDEKGHLRKGSVLNPKGRGKRTDEDKFNAVLLAVENPERFRRQTEKQAQKADNGDLESFKYLCKLLGLEVNRNEVTGADGEALRVLIEWSDTPGGDND